MSVQCNQIRVRVIRRRRGLAGAYREALFHGFKIFLDIFELLRLQYIGEHIKTILL